MNTNDNERLLKPAEAATYLGSTVASMNTMRHQGKLKIPFIKFGSHIRYRKTDLDAWIQANSKNVIKGDKDDQGI